MGDSIVRLHEIFSSDLLQPAKTELENLLADYRGRSSRGSLVSLPRFRVW